MNERTVRANDLVFAFNVVWNKSRKGPCLYLQPKHSLISTTSPEFAFTDKDDAFFFTIM